MENDKFDDYAFGLWKMTVLPYVDRAQADIHCLNDLTKEEDLGMTAYVSGIEMGMAIAGDAFKSDGKLSGEEVRSMFIDGVAKYLMPQVDEIVRLYEERHGEEGWRNKIYPDSDMQSVAEDALVVEMPHGYAVAEKTLDGINLSFYSKRGKWITDLAFFSPSHHTDLTHDDYILKVHRFNDSCGHCEDAMRFNALDIANAAQDWSNMTLAEAVRKAGKDWSQNSIASLAKKLDCDGNFTSIMEALADKLEDV